VREKANKGTRAPVVVNKANTLLQEIRFMKKHAVSKRLGTRQPEPKKTIENKHQAHKKTTENNSTH
jgi:hypothetical protein